jgi:small subunit ribosomal protein S20
VANHKQAIKRNRQRIVRQAHNRHFKATMRTFIKRVREAVDENNKEEASAALSKAVPIIDNCAQKGIIPRKRASRLVSRLTLAVGKL